jgi:hypothetical protein
MLAPDDGTALVLLAGVATVAITPALALAWLTSGPDPLPPRCNACGTTLTRRGRLGANGVPFCDDLCERQYEAAFAHWQMARVECADDEEVL